MKLQSLTVHRKRRYIRWKDFIHCPLCHDTIQSSSRLSGTIFWFPSVFLPSLVWFSVVIAANHYISYLDTRHTALGYIKGGANPAPFWKFDFPPTPNIALLGIQKCVLRAADALKTSLPLSQGTGRIRTPSRNNRHWVCHVCGNMSNNLTNLTLRCQFDYGSALFPSTRGTEIPEIQNASQRLCHAQDWFWHGQWWSIFEGKIRWHELGCLNRKRCLFHSRLDSLWTQPSLWNCFILDCKRANHIADSSNGKWKASIGDWSPSWLSLLVSRWHYHRSIFPARRILAPMALYLSRSNIPIAPANRDFIPSTWNGMLVLR